jgi:hypothetical protein
MKPTQMNPRQRSSNEKPPRPPGQKDSLPSPGCAESKDRRFLSYEELTTVSWSQALFRGAFKGGSNKSS